MMDIRKRKSNVLRGLLKNDQTSSIIKNAFNSPIGSTARKRAKSIAGILRKTGAMPMYDGQGGPGYQNPADYMQAMQPMPQDYSRFVVFPSAPAFNTGRMDGQGGPGTTTPSWTSGITVPGIPNMGQTPQTGLTSYGGSGTATAMGAPGPAYKNPLVYVRDPARDLTVGAKTTPGTLPILGKTPLTIGTPGSTQPTATTPQATSGAANIYPQNQTGGTQTLAGTTPPQTGGTTTPTPTEPGTTPQPETGTDLGGKLSNLQTLQQAAQSAVKTGTGAASFAYDKAGSLMEQVTELDTALKKQYDLDNILNQKNALIKRGITLETDLGDYIRGRDEYLNETQGMIDRFTDKMTTMDMGNPVVARQADTYMNYMYTLRGRQNKRYIEFLNSGINEYNAQLTDISNHYDKALNAYEKDLQLKTNVTQAEYQMYFNALSDMYNTLDQAPIKKMEMEKLRMEIDTGYQRAAIDAAKSSRSGSGLADDVGKIKGLVWDTKDNTNTLLPSVKSISGTINEFASDGSVDPYSVTWAIARGMENDLQGDAGAVMPKARNYMNMIAEYKAQAADEQTAADAFAMGQNIARAMQTSIKQSLSDPNVASTARDAVNSLTSPGWFGKGKVPSREDFIADYKEQLPTDLLDSMYSIFDQFKKDGGDTKLLFSSTGGLKNTTDTDLAANIAASVAGSELGLLAQY